LNGVNDSLAFDPQEKPPRRWAGWPATGAAPRPSANAASR
jgi:hypothetical protein